MKVELTKDLEAFVESQVRTGGYTDAGEVLRAPLRHFRDDRSWLDNDSPALEALLLAAPRAWCLSPINQSEMLALHRESKVSTW